MTDMERLWAEQMKDPEFRALVDKTQARNEVANAIFRTRVGKDLTQGELAKRAKVSQGDISRFENEEKDINLSTLDKIARAMGCRVQIRFVPAGE